MSDYLKSHDGKSGLTLTNSQMQFHSCHTCTEHLDTLQYSGVGGVEKT